jgi:hypothetical protein
VTSSSLGAIEQNSDGAVVEKGNFHVRAETSGFYMDA